MMNYKLYIIIIFILSAAVCCFEDDENIPPYPNDITTIYDDIEFYQSYFDFESNRVISVNDIGEWELGFECGNKGWHIITNSGNYWFIHNTRVTDFQTDLNLSENENWEYDNQEYYEDSTAIDKWVDINSLPYSYSDHVYLAGKLQNNIYNAFYKLQFFHVDSMIYRFRYSDLTNNIIDTVTIHKTDSTNFVYYSLQENTQQYLEPSNTEYDIVFSPYFTLVSELGYTLPYLVRGVFLNYGYTSAYVDSVISFDAVEYNTIDHSAFRIQKDLIGYDWKDINIDVASNSGTYTIKSNRTYVLKTQEENYFKLRFISYQLNGDNGYPRFEFQEIVP